MKLKLKKICTGNEERKKLGKYVETSDNRQYTEDLIKYNHEL